MTEPCLCGDPYCPGDPSAAAALDAAEGLSEAFKELNFTADEYAIAEAAGIAAVEAHRSCKAVDGIVREIRANDKQYIKELQTEIASLRNQIE